MAMKYETFRQMIIEGNENHVPGENSLLQVFETSLKTMYEKMQPKTRKQMASYKTSFWCGWYYGFTEGRLNGRQESQALLEQFGHQATTKANEMLVDLYTKPPWADVSKPELK